MTTFLALLLSNLALLLIASTTDLSWSRIEWDMAMFSLGFIVCWYWMIIKGE